MEPVGGNCPAGLPSGLKIKIEFAGVVNYVRRRFGPRGDDPVSAAEIKAGKHPDLDAIKIIKQ